MTSTAFLEGRRYCIAPHNDIAESLQVYLDTQVKDNRPTGYLDRGRAETPSIAASELDLILIISPNHYRGISETLLGEGILRHRLTYVVKGERFWFTSSQRVYRSLLSLIHLKKLSAHPVYLKDRLRHFLTSKTRTALSPSDKALAALRRKHQGRRAFIIGNGPSLRIEDLDRLKEEVTFAANKIYLAFDETDWRPTYYCVEDDLVLRQNLDTITAYQGSLKLFPNTLLKLAPPMHDVLYFDFHMDPFYPSRPAIGKDPFNGFYWGSTVVFTMIQLAIYMGVSEIYLLGVDFDFTIPESSQEQLTAITSEDEVNHFHKAYRRPGERWNVPNLHMQEHAFESVKAYGEQNGITIMNLSRNSALEVFAKADFDTIKDQ